MVNIKSSSGGFVKVEFRGVDEAMRKIIEKGGEIVDGVDAKTFQAANMIQQEIQESIAGHRSEEKSVDTGNFANSIEIEKVKDLRYKVFTATDYAQFLEYGTSRLAPRSHFRNSISRNRQKAIEIIKS